MTVATVGVSSPTTRPTRNPRLVANPIGTFERESVLHHIGRRALHASPTRDFAKAWRVSPSGRRPKLFAISSAAFARCQYAVLSDPARAAVIVLDVDQAGRAGGSLTSLAPTVRDRLDALCVRGVGPALVGINPLSGHCQLIWLIDPVYAAPGRESANTRLLTVTARRLASYLGADPHFSRVWSRSPFYTGNDPKAYFWYCQHLTVDRLAVLNEAMKMTDSHGGHQRFNSGRELIEAVRKQREEASAARLLLSELDADLASVERVGPRYIDGVNVQWSAEGRAARDQTAFEHALVATFRRKTEGLPLTDSFIIDAYETAYGVAQAVGADHREPAMPPLRDRQTMARRVRGYVVQGHRRGGSSGSGAATSSERAALATMGRRGGQTASQRWKTDPEGEYATTLRAKLTAANDARTLDTDENKGRVLAYISRERRAKREPSTREVADELGLSIRRVQQLRRSLGLQAKPGRPNKRATP